jgi:aminoglycoside N3'-acetyltransferase
MTEDRTVATREIVNQLRTLGVKSGGVLLVHTSFRAVRPVESGPPGLIDALVESVGSGGTLVMPSWTGSDDVVFEPNATPASADLGVVADMFWRMPGVHRSAHPFAFAALGRCARVVTSDPLPLPPHIPRSPIGRVHDLDGQVLLLGVGHDTNTTLHLAERLAGVPYGVPKHCTVEADGRDLRVDYRENDHCCQRFALADDWLRDRRLQSEGPVGHAHARLFRARDLVSIAVEQLKSHPLLFLHAPESRCGECDEARRSIDKPEGLSPRA